MIVPTGLKQLISIFGEAGNPQCSSGKMNLPEHIIQESRDKDALLTFKCHALIEPILESVYSEIMTKCPEYFYSFGGCYCKRPKRTRGTEMSVHSWGVAVDNNVAYNPLGHGWEKLLEKYKDKTYLLEVRGEKVETPCTNFVFTPTITPLKSVTALRKPP